MIALLHAAAGVSLWPQPSKVVINDPTLVTFTGNFAFISSGESSDELQNAIHRYTDLLHASGSPTIPGKLSTEIEYDSSWIPACRSP